MSRKSRLKTTILPALLASAALPAQAHAQAEPQQSQAAPVSSEGDIIVTAQRRAERLENVPAAVVALTPDALDRASVTNLHELGRIAPGVQINYGGAYTQPAIRGVTSLTNGTGNENNVAVYVDGFYVNDNITINTDLANLASIEILKGPQGTLYGRNATGGAILINTLAPSKELSFKAEGSYGRFDEKRLSGYLSGPLNEAGTIRFSTAGSFRNSDGNIKFGPAGNPFRSGNAAPVKQRSFRSKLQLDLTEDLTATLAYNYALTVDPRGLLFTTFAYRPATLPGGNQRATEFGTASYNRDTMQRGRSNEATLKVAYNTPIGTLTSYTGYAKKQYRTAFDFDGTYAELSYSDGAQKDKTFQQALDFVVDAIEGVDLVVGALYFDDKLDSLGSKAYGAGGALVQTTFTDLKTKAYAAYADATFHATDELSINVGGRYSVDKRFISSTIITAAGVTTFPYTEARAKFKRFTPRASIRYEVAPRSNIYASFSKGFRSGSFNAAGGPTPALLAVPVKPEDIKAYELGFKTASSWYRFEVAGFYYDYKNLNVAVNAPNPNCPAGQTCGPVTLTGNAPKASVKGVDTLLVITPVEKLNVSVGGAYLRAKYGRFPNAIGTGLNGTTNVNVPGQVQDWSGHQMARAPKLTATFSADYTVPVAGGGLLLSGNVNYSSSYVVSNPSLFGPLAGPALADKQRFRQGSLTLVNGEMTWTNPTNNYWIGLFGKNLTNKKYRATYNGANFGDYSTMANPITYGVKAGYKF